MRARLLVVLLVFGLVAAACGDDDTGGALTPDERALADAILADMIADNSDDDDMNPTEMRCFAEGVVGGLGVGRLLELGVTASDVGEPEEAFRQMNDGELDEMADVAERCIDYRTGFITAMTKDGIRQESAECLTDRLADTDFFRAAFIASMKDEDFSPQQDAELMSAFISGAQDCLTAEELTLIGFG